MLVTMMRGALLILVLCQALGAQATPEIVEWERGIALKAPDSDMAMYLWFYEWNMFEAMAPGQHTHGTYENQRRVSPDQRSAEIRTPALHLRVTAVPGGAELALQVTNTTDYQWPEIAGIIPCWSPGQVEGTDPSNPLPLNRNFADPARNRTYFVSDSGLMPLTSREIHFNSRLRALVEPAAGGKELAFSYKWPTSTVNAAAGYIVRESEDGQWVTGIGWGDFLSVQGHNPWSCMHACIRVGPLAPGQSKTVHGKLYLFRGTAAECAGRFQRDFAAPPLVQFQSRLASALSKHLDMLLDANGNVAAIKGKSAAPLTAFSFSVMHQLTGNLRYRSAAVQLADRVLAQMKATPHGVLTIGDEEPPGGGPPPLGWYASILGYIYHREGGRDNDLRYLATVLDKFPWNSEGWWSAHIDTTTGQSVNPLEKQTQVNKNAAMAMAAGMLSEYVKPIDARLSDSLKSKADKCIYQRIIPAQQSDGFWHYNLTGHDPKNKDAIGYFMLSSNLLIILQAMIPSYRDPALNACLARAGDFALKNIAPPAHYDLESDPKRGFDLAVLLFATKNFGLGMKIADRAMDQFPYGHTGQAGAHAAHPSAVMLMLLEEYNRRN